MFGLTTIIIICIFLLITYFIYQLLIDNLKMTKKIENTFSDKVDEVFDKINDTYNLINKKTDNIITKIKEYNEIELKKNELNILNNQKIVEKHIFQDEENNEFNSPITENFFIKHNENKDKELYYMSPVIKTSNNSNMISITSKESLFKDIDRNIINIDNTSNDNSSKKSSIRKYSKYSSKSENFLSKSSDLLNKKDDISLLSDSNLSSKEDQVCDNDNEVLYDNNMFKINFLNNNLNYFNIIENINKNENDSMKIKDEDRVEEL